MERLLDFAVGLVVLAGSACGIVVVVAAFETPPRTRAVWVECDSAVPRVRIVWEECASADGNIEKLVCPLDAGCAVPSREAIRRPIDVLLGCSREKRSRGATSFLPFEASAEAGANEATSNSMEVLQLLAWILAISTDDRDNDDPPVRNRQAETV